MPTCFLAIPLPDSVRDSLAQIRPPRLPGVKLVRPDKMHLTLHYLGQITPEDIEQVKTAISEIVAPCFSCDIIGVGTFPEKGKPRVLWAGVSDNPVLDDLHQQLGTALTAAIGFQPETRPFNPHITLARLQRPATREQLSDYWTRYEEFKIPGVPVERFVLYESTFVDGRSAYSELATRELKIGSSQ